MAREVPKVASIGVTTMLDASLDDDAKEKAVQQAGLKLLKLSWQLAWRVLICLAAVLPPILLADVLGLAPSESSFDTLLRLDFVVLVSLAAVALGWIWKRRGNSRDTAPVEVTSDAAVYRSGDRLMHAFAFSGPSVHRVLTRLDDRLYRSTADRVPDAPPIFITSLARGGTTALLGALHDHPDIATHLYRDMPFLSAPLLWNRLSGRRTDVAVKERAHGDGIKISLQSPEAFDEVFWMLNWPEKYQADRIDLWRADDFSSDAMSYFTHHFRKIAVLRRPGLLDETDVGRQSVRYLSKNNANIARLELLPELFPGCQILVPLREPSAHAASLYRQHQNFKKLHGEDSFSKRYMKDIGHFEFGDLHRPIAFNMSALVDRSPDEPDYWLSYWLACFETVAKDTAAVSIVAQDTLRAEPNHVMASVLEHLGLDNETPTRWESVFLRSPDRPMDDLFDRSLLDRARSVYASLHEGRLGR